MLILTRRIGEKIIIGDDIKIIVHSVRGNQVRIGINAPKDVKVLRSELENFAPRNHAERSSRIL